MTWKSRLEKLEQRERNDAWQEAHDEAVREAEDWESCVVGERREALWEMGVRFRFAGWPSTEREDYDDPAVYNLALQVERLGKRFMRYVGAKRYADAGRIADKLDAIIAKWGKS